MPLPKSTMTVDFLPDGTIRTETGDMGGVDHKSADQFLTDLANYLGGAVQETKIEHGHVHTHARGHSHGDAHHHH